MILKEIKYTIMLLVLLSSLTATAQKYATTEDGERVILYENRTWELIDLNKSSLSYIYMGQEKLMSGERELVFEGQFNSTMTYIQLAKKEKQKVIIFWEESDFQFQEGLWTNDALLFLEDGNTIKLIDRNIKGTNIIKDAHVEETLTGFSIKQDLHQRYILFYLSISDCEKLKKSDISSISYIETIKLQEGRKIMSFNKNQSTCKRQLNALDN